MSGTIKGREVDSGTYRVSVRVGFNRFETGLIVGISEYHNA